MNKGLLEPVLGGPYLCGTPVRKLILFVAPQHVIQALLILFSLFSFLCLCFRSNFLPCLAQPAPLKPCVPGHMPSLSLISCVDYHLHDLPNLNFITQQYELHPSAI
jgi:hypothetical protein